MERENRYLVIKQADIDVHLDAKNKARLEGICEHIRQCREYYGKRDKGYVVVADDWPMYEAVWSMIAAWVDGGAPPSMGCSTAWSESLPNKQAYWWWWNGDADAQPILVSILYGGTARKYFASVGQHGWSRAQYVEDMGGWWMKAAIPEPPRQ